MRRILSAGLLALLILPACGRRGAEPAPAPDGPYALDVRALDGGPTLRLAPVAQGFTEPWGFAFLPRGACSWPRRVEPCGAWGRTGA